MIFLFYFILYGLIASNCRCMGVEERRCLSSLADYCGRIITSSRLFCCAGPASTKAGWARVFGLHAEQHHSPRPGLSLAFMLALILRSTLKTKSLHHHPPPFVRPATATRTVA